MEFVHVDAFLCPMLLPLVTHSQYYMHVHFSPILWKVLVIGKPKEYIPGGKYIRPLISQWLINVDIT